MVQSFYPSAGEAQMPRATIETNFKELSEALSSIGVGLQELRQRLDPVLMARPRAAEESGKGGLVGGRCRVVSNMIDAATHARAHIAFIQELLQELDI